MFDHETGERIKSRDGNGWDLRKGKAPCEVSVGCPKGHWKDEPDLSSGEEAVLKLYELCKVSAGTMLTEAERQDDFLAFMFGLLASQDKIIAEQKQHQFMTSMIASMVRR